MSYEYGDGFDEGYEEGFRIGCEETHKEIAELTEHLWHAALTADDSITQEEFRPEDLPGIVQEALEEAEVDRDAFEERVRDLESLNETLQFRLDCCRHDRKAREKRIRRASKEKAKNLRRELRESKARSREIQHELYVALKLSEERERELRHKLDIQTRKVQELDAKFTVLESEVVSLHRANGTAAHDLAALTVLADGLGLPGTEERQTETDFDRLSNVLDRCYVEILGSNIRST